MIEIKYAEIVKDEIDDFDLKEIDDFKRYTKFINTNYSGSTSNFKIVQRPFGSRTDAKMTGTTKNNTERHYNIELKDRLFDSSKYQSVYIDAEKYINMYGESRICNERPLYVNYFTDGKIAIWDLDKINFYDLIFQEVENSKTTINSDGKKRKHIVALLPIKDAIIFDS